MATLRRWLLTKIDLTAASLETRTATRVFYVTPSRESLDCGKLLWLLLIEAYGLLHANAKYKIQSDAMMLDIGFKTSASTLRSSPTAAMSCLTALSAKVVHDVLLPADRSCSYTVVKEVNSRSPAPWQYPVLWPQHQSVI